MKIAVLGAGAMGETIMGHLRDCPEETTVYCYDIDTNRALHASKEFDAICVEKLNDILENEDIELVFIASSNSSHTELALASLRAGKSVMLEKPIAPTFEESQMIVNEAERLGGFLQVGFELRYSKLYKSVKKWIDEGRLGSIVNVSGNYICSEFHKKGSWRNAVKTGGSMCGEKLSHYLDLMRWWTGSEPEEVYAVAAPNVVQYFEVNDNYHITSRFEDGSVGNLTFMMFVAETFDGDPLQNPVSQQNDDGHELRMLVVGTEGAAETDVFKRRIRRWKFSDGPEGIVSELVETLTWNEEADHRYFHNTEAQTWDIVRRVRSGLPPLTSGADAIETMRLCHAVDRSVESGKLIEILKASPMVEADYI